MTAELEQKLLSRSDSGKDENEDEEKHPGHKSLEKYVLVALKRWLTWLCNYDTVTIKLSVAVL